MKFFEEITGTKFLGTIGSVFVVTVGGTWALAQKLQSDELQGYKASQELHLKDAISSLSSYAEAAKLTSAERTRLTALEKQVPDLVKTNTEMKAKLDAVTRDRDSLRTTVSSMLQKNAEIEIPVGQARSIVPNSVTIGVANIAGTSVDVTFKGKSEFIDVGTELSFDVAGKSYTATLTKVTKEAATFVVTGPAGS